MPLLDQIQEQGFGGGQTPMGVDLTPIKNRAREAVEALTDAQRACDSGRSEDALEAMKRARAAIDAALGGQFGTGASMPVPNAAGSGAGSYGGDQGAGRF